MNNGHFYMSVLMLVCGVAWSDVKVSDVKLPLPPLAVVTGEDGSGATWKQSGELKGTVEGVCAEFRQALAVQGWRIEKVIATGHQTSRLRLLACCCKQQRVLVMVWEKEVGLCGFAWGLDA